MTDMTMLIISCRRRNLRASSACSLNSLPSGSAGRYSMRSPFCNTLDVRGISNVAPVLLRRNVRPTRYSATLSGGGKLPLDVHLGDRRRHPRDRGMGTAVSCYETNHGGSMPEPTNASFRPDPNEKLVKIFDTEQETEAIVVQGLLESAGIESDLKSIDAVQDAFPGVGGTVLLVREDDAAEAEKIIDAYRKLPPLDDETADIPG